MSRLKLPLLAGMGLALIGSATAQTSGTWNVNANGNWGTAGSWLGNIIPDGAGGTANFNFDINADRTVTIDTNRTIGNLLVRDGAVASNAYIIGLIASTNVFTMDDGANKPTITLYPRTGTAIIARIDQPVSGTNGMEIISGDVAGVRVEMAYGNVVNPFSGSVSVGRDVRLRLDNNGNLGTADALTTATSGLPTVVNFTEVLNNGTLNTNAKNLGTEYVKAQGAGVDGTGALVNLGAGQNNTFQQVELTGHTTFGGSGRWDIRTATATTGRLYQNDFAITKAGANQISLVNVTVVGGGDVNVNQGVMALETASIVGGAGTINVNTGGSLNFWANTGAVTRNIAANGGAINHPNTTATANIASNLDLTVPNTNISQLGTGTLNLNGNVSGTGGVTKTGPGTLNLGGANTFSGSIVVSAGNLGVTGAGTLAGNNALSLASGSVFTAPAGGHTIGTGRTLLAGRIGATAANDIVGSIALQDNAVFEIGNSGRNGGLDPVATATITGNLAFGTGGTIYQDLGNTTIPGAGVSDLITCANLSVLGTTTINVTPVGGGLAPGSYTLILYSGVGTGLGNLVLGPLPSGTRQSFALNTSVPGVVSLVVTGAAANLTWVGNGSTNLWDVNTSSLWNNGVGSDVFKNLDSVTFNASGSNSPAVSLTGNLSPGNITVTGAQDYTFGGAGVLEDGAITKTGSGKLTIAGNAHTFGSSVQINAGTVSVAEVNNGGLPGPLGINPTINFDGGTLEFTGVSQNVNRVLNLGAAGGTVSVPNAASRLGTNLPLAGAGTLNVQGAGSLMVGVDDAVYTFASTITGNGNFALNPHMAVGSTTSYQVPISGNLNSFTGNLVLASPASGSWRTNNLLQPALGTTDTVVVEDGAQLWTAAGTVTTNTRITGIGYLETNGTGIGALRIEGATIAGNVEIVGSAAIGAHNGTGTVSGNISGGTLLTGGTNFNNNYTLVLTGMNSHAATVVNQGGTGANTSLLQVGAGGTAGTLGNGPVTVNGDTKNGILRFSRSDAYTLGIGQTITAGGATPAKAFLDLDVQGTGFNNAGQTINFTGGILRTGVTVADANATLSGTVNAGNIQVGVLNATILTNNATLNIAAGATVTANNLNVANGGGTAPLGNTNEASVNIAVGATIAIATNLFLGDQNSSGASVTQAGGSVSVGSQFRIGHWPNETSTYTLNGGSILANGVRTQFPQAGNETAGGIYLGIDGTGILTQNAGTITTGWVVLDNRGDTAAGVDTYNLNGGELILTGADGIISRNASALFNWNGGTITANTSFNLDTNKIAVIGASTLNTNGNTVTLLAPLAGSAALSVNGGGTLVTANSATANFAGGGSFASVPVTVSAGTTLQSNTTPADTWVSVSGGGALNKTGAGQLTLTGDSSAFAGTATVSTGKLAVNGTLGGAIQVNSGGILGGTGTVGTPTVASGGIVNPGSGVTGTLTLASLSLASGSLYQVDITDAGTSDKVKVTGTLAANGTIALILTGYVPEDGDSFDIADAATTTGTPTFDFSAAVLAPGLSWDTSMFGTNGTIRVTSGSDPYVAWAGGFGLMGLDAAKGADPDFDGMNNLMEFAINGNPASGTKARRIIPAMYSLSGDSVLTVTIAVRQGTTFASSGSTQVATRDQVLYTVEATSDLAVWNVVVVTQLNPVDSTAVQATLSLPALDAGWEWQSFRTDDGVSIDPNDSLRLKVAVAP